MKPFGEEHTTKTITYESFQSEIRSWIQRLSEYRNHERIDVLEAAIQYIDEHLFEDDLSLEKVAGKLGLTPTYFSHYFKKHTNETFRTTPDAQTNQSSQTTTCRPTLQDYRHCSRGRLRELPAFYARI